MTSTAFAVLRHRAGRCAMAAFLPLALAGCTSLGATQTAFAPQGAAAAVGMETGLVSADAAIGDAENRSIALAAEYRALEYEARREPTAWTGRDGVSGEVVAYQPYRVGQQDCRQYMHSIRTGSDVRVLRGAACRSANGSWSVI